MAEQPELPDGTRWCALASSPTDAPLPSFCPSALLMRRVSPRPRSPVATEGEAGAVVAKATVPAKLQHKLALEQAIAQVDQENAELQRQYTAQLPRLQEASAEISSCMARMQQTATTCEQWRRPDISAYDRPM